MSLDKENVPVVNDTRHVTGPEISKTTNRRVSFASIGINQAQPPVTPRRVQGTQTTYQTPTAFNYLAAMQSPYTPSFNYTAYNGPLDRVGALNGFAVGSQFLPGFYTYPASQATAASSVPVYTGQGSAQTNQNSNVTNPKTRRA